GPRRDARTGAATSAGATQPSGRFISMRMEHKSRLRPRPIVIREDLLRDLSCDICARKYAVYAIALFCPDCGAPNLALHFRREVALIREQIVLAETQNAASQSEIAYRLMGNAHEDVVTAFETTLKTVYRYLVRRHMPDKGVKLCAKKGIGNAFQNIDRGRERFLLFGIDPYSTLTADDLSFLALNIEKRHVIGHNLGIADEHYVELTQTNQPGETVSLLRDEIGRFADICLAVVTGLEGNLLSDTQVLHVDPACGG
ncbi:MAG: hypothetical protein MI741_10890, partial [Rhodospirillales bacterium]|nr:hypothetical protein [Rhodospirillales bacterium]